MDKMEEKTEELNFLCAVLRLSYMGLWQLQALTSVLHRPVYSIYPQHGGHTVRHHLHQAFHPRCKDDGSFMPEIMWTHTQGDELPAVIWRPNHFVVCLPAIEFVLNQGDFVLVGVPTVAQIFKLTEDGAWGVFLKDVGSGKWKFPEKTREFFLPQGDILKILKDYKMRQENRALVYCFDL